MKTVAVADFGVLPGKQEGNALGMIRLLRETGHTHNLTISFEPGEYHFYADQASESWYAVSNNDSGRKRVAISLVNAEKVTIEGNGAHLLFHGRITPFALEGCLNVTLRNLAIDWADNHIIQARVDAVAPGSIDLTIEDGYDFETANDTFFLKGCGWRSALGGFIEIDPATGSPALGSADHCGAPWHSHFSCTALADRKVRIGNQFARLPAVGTCLLLTHQQRTDPGVLISGCTDTVLENVTLYQAPAMAIIAQYSTNVTLLGCAVRPRPDSGRYFSACADATHFVNCAGTVRVEGCHFEGQHDDALNVHGIYGKVLELRGQGELLVGLMHAQQKGVAFAFDEDILRFVNALSLAPGGSATVTDCTAVNADMLLVRCRLTAGDLPAVGDLVENMSWTPEFVFRRNRVVRNRARGLLVSTPRKALIEDNEFATSGSAIQSGGEGVFWFESGPLDDLIIRNNRFVDCLYADWGSAIIELCPSLKEQPEGSYYHRTIRIENNEFVTFHPHLLAALSVDTLVFESNRVQHSQTYPARDTQSWLARLENCRGVRFCNNGIDSAFGATGLVADSRTQKTLSTDLQGAS